MNCGVRSAIFWDFTQRRIVILITNVRLDLKFGPVGFPDTSVSNQQYTLRNIPEDRRPQCKNCTQNVSKNDPVGKLHIEEKIPLKN